MNLTNYRTKKEAVSTSRAPVLIAELYRSIGEAGVRSFGGDAVYIARNMLNLDMDAIEADFAKAPPKQLTDAMQSNAKLYPNPAKDEVMIEFDHILNANAILEIYGYAGNLLQTSVLKSGYQFISVSVKELKSGIYYYRIISNSEVIEINKLLIIK